MGYYQIAEMVGDNDLRNRLTACAAQEVTTGEHPSDWVNQRIWRLCAASDWADAYTYARNTNNPAPGRDEAVITDQMILSRVQHVRDNP
jgi:hypothetical protein